MLSHATQSLPIRLESTGNLSIPPMPLTSSRVVVGSHPDCEIVLHFQGVASQHCTLTLEAGELRIEAHSPMTWLNDDPVRASVLRNGDRLVVGPVQLRVVMDRIVKHDESASARPHSESIFDDEEDHAPNDPSQASQETSISGSRSHGSPDANALADSRILNSHDTVVIDRSRLGLNLTGDPSHCASRLAKLADSPSIGVDASNSVTPYEPPPIPQAAPVEIDVVAPQSRPHDLHKYLEERCQLLDERESELNELYAEVSARRSQLLQQQQQWEVLYRNATLPRASDEIEQADRRAQAARQLAEQQEMLEALRRELHLRDAATREARKRVEELEKELEHQSSQLELLEEKEALHQRGSAEFNVLAGMLESESQAIAQRREELRAAEQQTLALAADWELRQRELTAARHALDVELMEFQTQRAELAVLSNKLVERDRQLMQSEYSLTVRVSEIDQREQGIAAKESEFTERLQALSQLQCDIDGRSRELDTLRCSLSTELQDAHLLQQSLKERESHVAADLERLTQQMELLQLREQTLCSRETEIRDLETHLEQNRAVMVSRETELTQRIAAADLREADLRTLETTLADARQEQEEAITQHQREQAAERAELDALRQRFEAEQAAWNEAIREQREKLQSKADELDLVRQRQEQELSHGFEQLAAQIAEVNAREQEVMRLREELKRQTAEPDADPHYRDQSGPDHGQPLQLLQLQQECEAWQERLSIVEQSLAERSQELDEAERRIEQQRQELDVCWSRRESLPSETAGHQSLQSTTTMVAAQTLEPAAESITAAERASSEMSALNTVEPEVQTLRHQLAELFGIESLENVSASSAEHDNARHVEEPVVEETETVEIVKPAVAIPPSETHAHDSVESYWKRLLDRNRYEQANTHTVKVEQTLKAEPKPAEAPRAAERPQLTSAPLPEGTPAVIVSTWHDQEQRGRVLDQDDRNALRAHMSSLRAVANQSARSAVAKHFSKQMTVQYHVKGVITLISGVVCIVLLTSPIWSNISYIEQGIAALVVTGVMGTLLWFDYRKLSAVDETVAVGDDDEGGATALEPTALKTAASQEFPVSVNDDA